MQKIGRKMNISKSEIRYFVESMADDIHGAYYMHKMHNIGEKAINDITERHIKTTVDLIYNLITAQEAGEQIISSE